MEERLIQLEERVMKLEQEKALLLQSNTIPLDFQRSLEGRGFRLTNIVKKTGNFFVASTSGGAVTTRIDYVDNLIIT